MSPMGSNRWCSLAVAVIVVAAVVVVAAVRLFSDGTIVRTLISISEPNVRVTEPRRVINSPALAAQRGGGGVEGSMLVYKRVVYS